jgi:hypothetical protein
MSVAETFGRLGFARFVNSPAGRVARVVAGLALIGWLHPAQRWFGGRPDGGWAHTPGRRSVRLVPDQP